MSVVADGRVKVVYRMTPQDDAMVQRVATLWDRPKIRVLETAIHRLMKKEAINLEQKAYIASSQSNEWRTPPYVLDRVVEVMGYIDLDPTAHPSRNTPALTHWTQEDDSLPREWFGKVFMNPPYSTETGTFLSKLVAEYQCGRVSEAIALVAARPDTQWWHQNMWTADLICWKRGRIQFLDALGMNVPGTTFASVLAYWGPHPDTFAKVMEQRDFGVCTQVYEPSSIAMEAASWSHATRD